MNKYIDRLFPHAYPREPQHSGNRDLEQLLHRKMEIHVTRSSYGELLVVGANTGREVWPEVVFRDEWLGHCFPQMNTKGGWKTRFDGGKWGLAEPGFIVGLYYRGVPGDDDFYDLTDKGAIILHRYHEEGVLRRKLFFREAPYPEASVNVLVDDGLMAMHTVMSDLFKTGGLLGEAELSKSVKGKLLWGVEQVEGLFGQGPIPCRKQK